MADSNTGRNMPESTTKRQFYQELSSQAGAQVTSVSPEFQRALISIISNLSYSPTLKVFGPYASAFGLIREYLSYRSPQLSTSMSFGVMPIHDVSTDSYHYALISDEAGIWPILAPETESVKKMTDEEHQEMITYPKILKFFQDEYGVTDGLTKLTGKLRFILMHEAGHVMLAHSYRKLQLAERFGIDLTIADYQNAEPKQVAMAQFSQQSMNYVGDAYINEGLSIFWNSVKPILKNTVEKVFADELALLPEKLEAEVKHMYDFNPDEMRNSGVFREAFEKYLKEHLKDYPDLLSAADKLITQIQDRTFVGQTIEEDAMILLWSAALRNLADNKCPSCGNPMQSSAQQTQSEDNISQDDENQEGNTSGSDQNGDTQDGSGVEASNITDDDTAPGQGQPGQGQPGQGQPGQGQPGQGQPGSNCGSGCACCHSANQSYSTTTVQANSSSGSMSIDVTIDQNGNIVSIQPSGTQQGKMSSKKIEELSTSTARKLAEASDLAAESLTDEERQRFRGFGSILNRSLGKITAQEFPWTQILSSFVASLQTETSKPSWISPVRALKRMGYHYPDEAPATDRDAYSLLFMLDASGSVSSKELKQAVGAILTAAQSSIQNIYVIAHDSDLGNISTNNKLAALAKRCGADRKVLQQYNVLKISVSDARRQRKKLLKLLEAFSESLPGGGTSHVTPMQTLINNGFVAKELRGSKVSGLVCFTDCFSDLEKLPSTFRELLKTARLDPNKTKVAIVNSDATYNYSHSDWPVVSVNGQVTDSITTSNKRAQSSSI